MTNPEPENIDYQETLNVTKAHAAAWREKSLPTVRHEPLSMWPLVGCAIVIIFGAGYLGANHAEWDMMTFKNPIYGANAPGGKVVAGAEELPPDQAWIKAGRNVFKAKCIACHQATGQGVPGQFPPLAGSEWVVNGDERPVMVVMRGLNGPITVKGAPYNSAMQNLALKDKEVAQVVSYIRNEWGNAAPFVTEENVVAAQEKYAGHPASFTVADLEKVPADQDLPGAEFGAAAGGGETAETAEPPPAE